jgi:uncharacterized surface protein with fasciclin (FAS1) repeats
MMIQTLEKVTGVKKLTVLLAAFVAAGAMTACTPKSETPATAPAAPAAGPNEVASGQAGVQDDVSTKNIVQVAVGSKDHTTLVAALKAAEYVDVLANPGPFTVFAPTNAAFDKLPKGTVDELVKPAKKGDLRNILEYHVFVGVVKKEAMKDGQVLGQANGDNVTLTVKDGKTFVNGNEILASIPVANGVIHVIDTVLLPPAKK